MVLVDIGNTHIHIFENGKVFNVKDAYPIRDKVYYISVNDKKERDFLKFNPDAVNLKDKVKFDTSYKNLGIDRVMACKAVDDGVVVDAGSAVTIDIMQDNIHLGGVIMPGISAFREAFGRISPKLNVDFCEVDFKKLPQNTCEAISFGSIGAVVLMIENLRKNKIVYFTGGDGKFLNKFVDGIYIRDLVFRGMIKTIKEDL